MEETILPKRSRQKKEMNKSAIQPNGDEMTFTSGTYYAHSNQKKEEKDWIGSGTTTKKFKFTSEEKHQSKSSRSKLFKLQTDSETSETVKQTQPLRMRNSPFLAVSVFSRPRKSGELENDKFMHRWGLPLKVYQYSLNFIICRAWIAIPALCEALLVSGFSFFLFTAFVSMAREECLSSF